LELTGLTSQNTGAVTFADRIFPLNSGNNYSVTMSALFGTDINGSDISVGSMRALFGDYVTFNGVLKDNLGTYTQRNVTLTINLGTDVAGELNNEWATMMVDGTTVTAIIKPDQEGTLLSSMGITSMLIESIGVLPASISIVYPPSDGSWISPSTSAGRIAIQDAIAESLDGSPLWQEATLVELAGHSIYFKKQGDTAVYELRILSAIA